MAMVRLLGPVDVVTDDGSERQSGSALQRTILALLGLHAGQVLSPDWLMEHVWGDNRPESGATALRFHVSKLRKEIDNVVPILTRPGGYTLDVPRETVDALRLDDAVRDVRLEEGERGAERCIDALRLWRGQPFIDAAPCEALDHEATRLEEARMTIVEHYQRCRLASGGTADLLPELRRLVAEHPLREGLWSSLILAQYRAGQQAEALRSYERLRTNLADELGLDPSPELRELQLRVLSQDPALLLARPEDAEAVRRGRARGTDDSVSDGRALPSGTVTFVLTDVEGSTKLAHALGEDFGDLMARHHEILRAAWNRHGGHELWTEGDAFIVVFAEADDALLAAVDAQRRFATEPWTDGREVRIRIGLHAGYARPLHGDYQALALNQASRIVDCAHGGQTFATDEVAALLTDRSKEAALRSLGRYRVRDFDGPVRLHAVVAEGMPVIGSAPRVPPAEGHNVISPTSPLLGRDDEVAQILATLRPRSLLTLAGPGGVGKTRLAIELTIRAAPAWPDGAWFVDLSSVVAAVDVPGAIAEAIGASVAPGQEVWSEVLRHLESRQALLILDNCEHLVEFAAPAVHDVLARCAGCAVLTTSRVPLGLLEERVHRLEMLAVTRDDEAGVQLFVQRSADPDRLHMPDVIALCAELEGLPLAIELAAARTSAISPADILSRLRAVPTVLRSRDPAVPERHRSLTRSLDWSTDLLDDAAMAVYGRLSVFASGFSLEAAERVCAGGDVGADDVAELVWGLVDASLVVSDEAAGTTRYRLLRIVRQHAASTISAVDVAAATSRLARYEIEHVGPSVPLDRVWLGTMDLELDNVRAVVRVLSERDGTDAVAMAQTLAWSIGRYHDSRSSYRAGIDEVTRWAQLLPEPTEERAAMMALLAELHLRLGESTEAVRALEEGEAIGVLPSWDNTSLARSRGELAVRRGDLAGAVVIANDALPRATTPRAQARLLNLLGIAYCELGQNDLAIDSIRREIAAATSAGMESMLVFSYGNLAETMLRAGDELGAAEAQLACLEWGRALGSFPHSEFAVVIAAHLVASEGQWALAVELQSAADVELERVGWASYDVDIERRERLLARARDELGATEFATAIATGAGLTIDAAADIATAQLRRIAANKEERT